MTNDVLYADSKRDVVEQLFKVRVTDSKDLRSIFNFLADKLTEAEHRNLTEDEAITEGFNKHIRNGGTLAELANLVTPEATEAYQSSELPHKPSGEKSREVIYVDDEQEVNKYFMRWDISTRDEREAAEEFLIGKLPRTVREGTYRKSLLVEGFNSYFANGGLPEELEDEAFKAYDEDNPAYDVQSSRDYNDFLRSLQITTDDQLDSVDEFLISMVNVSNSVDLPKALKRYFQLGGGEHELLYIANGELSNYLENIDLESRNILDVTRILTVFGVSTLKGQKEVQARLLKVLSAEEYEHCTDEQGIVLGLNEYIRRGGNPERLKELSINTSIKDFKAETPHDVLMWLNKLHIVQQHEQDTLLKYFTRIYNSDPRSSIAEKGISHPRGFNLFWRRGGTPKQLKEIAAGVHPDDIKIRFHARNFNDFLDIMEDLGVEGKDQMEKAEDFFYDFARNEYTEGNSGDEIIVIGFNAYVDKGESLDNFSNKF